MKISKDGNGSPYIEWSQSGEHLKRAWIQRKTDQRDWAGTGRYLNVVRRSKDRPGSGGNPTDFPIFYSDAEKSDEDILRAFVKAACEITGCQLPED